MAREAAGNNIRSRGPVLVNLEYVQCPKNHVNLSIIVDFFSLFIKLHLRLQIYACLDTSHCCVD